MRVNGECPWSTGGGHAVPWGYYEEPIGKRGVTHPPGYENGSYECRLATYCGHDGCTDKRKPPPVKEEPRVTGELAREYQELRRHLRAVASFAWAYADKGDTDGLREELLCRIDNAQDFLWRRDRCGARPPAGIWGCDRPKHTDQWHVSEMGGCWPEYPGEKEES